jgi:hypothetical protein
MNSVCHTKNTNDGVLTLLKTSEEIWKHHINSLRERNLEEILSDYSDDSFIIVNNIVVSGREKLSVLFEKIFKLLENGKQTMIGYTIQDNIVFITWNYAPNNDTKDYFGSDSFVISNGKIQAQTIASIYPITG